MLNFLINFCLITFLCYAVAGPVKAILFPQKRRTRRAVAAQTRRHASETLSPAYGKAHLANTVLERRDGDAFRKTKNASETLLPAYGKAHLANAVLGRRDGDAFRKSKNTPQTLPPPLNKNIFTPVCINGGTEKSHTEAKKRHAKICVPPDF